MKAADKPVVTTIPLGINDRAVGLAVVSRDPRPQ